MRRIASLLVMSLFAALVVSWALPGTAAALGEGTSIYGTVSDAVTMEVLPGTGIDLYDTDYNMVSWTEADETGVYEFAVPDGDYFMIANGSARYDTEWWIPVTADNATPTEKNIALNPKPRVVHGTVSDAGGTGISWESVSLYAEVDDFIYDYWGYTDENGFYEIYATMPHGTYRLTASASRFLSSSQDYAYSGTDEQVDFTLENAPKAFAGVLTDAATGATVSGWVNAEGESASGDMYSEWDYPESDGVYSIYLPSGTYHLTGGRSNYYPVDKGSLAFDGVHTVTRNMALASYPTAVTGRITNAATGLVPKNAELYFTNHDGISGWVSVDSQGYYSVKAPNGTYRLEVGALRMKPQVADVTFSGATVTRNFALQASPKAVYGTVRDYDTDAPLAERQVSLDGYDAANGIYIYDWDETDANGAYEVYAPAGDYTVSMDTDYGYFGDSYKVSFNGTTAVQQDFSLKAFPVAFTGQVTDSETSDPIEGADIWAEADGEDFYYYAYTTSGAGGDYELRLPAGTYAFNVEAAGHAQVYESGSFDGTDVTVKNFELRPVLRAFYGKVTDFDSDDPVRGEVSLYFNDGDLEYEDWTETDAWGGYELYGPKGEAQISCYAERYERLSKTDTFDGTDATEVNFAPRHHPRAFTGHVTDGATSLPLADAGVNCWFDTEDMSYEDWSSTDDQGAYALYGPAGAYQLSASEERYASSDKSREFDGTTEEVVDFVLNAYPKAFYGFVTQAGSGTPVEHASVNAYYDDENGYYEDWTDSAADGSYALYAPPATYDVSASFDDYQTQRVRLPFSGTAVRKDFALTKFPKAFYGKVTNASTHAPVAGVDVGAWYETDMDYVEDWDTTDEAGSYELYLSANSSYEFHVHGEGYEHFAEEVGAFDGVHAVEHNVEIVQYPLAIHGTVTNADTGLPMPSVWVYAYLQSPEADPAFAAVTDNEGNYEIHAPEGSYSVSPWLPSYPEVTKNADFDGTTAQQVDFDMAFPGTDTQAPTTEIDEIPAGWVNHDVSFYLWSDDGDGVGVYRTFYKLGSGATQTYAQTPVKVSAEGSTIVSFWSKDLLDNTESVKTATIRIDKTAPVTSSNALGTYLGSASVALSPADSGGSAVKATYWRVDGGAWNTGTSASAFGVGSHTLQFYSVDNAGNAEAQKSATFQIAGAPTFLSVTPSTTSPGTYGATVTFTGSLKRDSAAGAGVAGVPVLVRAFAAGAWTDAANLTTGADGSLSWAAAPLSTTTYEFIFTGNSTLASASTVSVTIVPKASIAKVTTKRVSSRTYKLTGSVKAGAAAKTYVRVYRWKKVGKKWKAYKYVKVTAKKSGSVLKYSLKHKFPSKGSWRLQAVSPADANHGASKSKYTYVKVK